MPTSTFYYSDGSTTTSTDTIITQSSYDRGRVLTRVNIDSGVTSIGNDAFLLCEDLTSVIIPDGVTSIGNFAFHECRSLISITIPNSVTNIGARALKECNLNRVNFLGNAPTLGIDAFLNNNANLKIYRKKNFVTGWTSTFGGKPVVLISDNVIKSGASGKLTTKKRYLYIATGTGLSPNIDGLRFYDSGLKNEVGLPQPIYYDETNTYQLSYTGTTWAIKLIFSQTNQAYAAPGLGPGNLIGTYTSYGGWSGTVTISEYF